MKINKPVPEVTRTINKMRDVEQRKAAKDFAAYWQNKGYEKGESQKFWLSLLRDVYGVEHPEQMISFEDQVHLDHTSFIDAMIPKTHVMIEQKALGKNLKAAIKQSDGSLLTPFQQAKRYSAELPYSQRPRWIVTCNFSTFHIYDMEQPGGEPEEIQLADLEKEYYRLNFLVDSGNEHLKKEMEVSIQAGELVGVLYDALLEQYADKTSDASLKSLNMLCVRLVFCLYAEDAGIFGKKGMFHDLRYFAEQEYFDAHEDLYIYMPDKILRYQIFTSYEYDDRHLLASFDFKDEEVYAEYLEEIMNPRSMYVMLRESVELDKEDRIVTLSTCVANKPNNRRLVQAVLVEELEAEYKGADEVEHEGGTEDDE